MGQYIPFSPSELQPINLNNFFAHFTVGIDPYPSSMPEGFSRTNFRNLECWDKSYKDALVFLGLSESATVLSEHSDRSDKRLNQTQEQFYAEIDMTMGKLGMEMTIVQKRINAYVHDTRCEDCKNPRELSRNLDSFLSPVYVALRKKGYNPSDLIA